MLHILVAASLKIIYRRLGMELELAKELSVYSEIDTV